MGNMTAPSARGLRTKRLAMSFLLHYHRQDAEGMNAILASLDNEDGEDPTRFALALAGLVDFVLTERVGDNAFEYVLTRAITEMAKAEGETP